MGMLASLQKLFGWAGEQTLQPEPTPFVRELERYFKKAKRCGDNAILLAIYEWQSKPVYDFVSVPDSSNPYLTMRNFTNAGVAVVLAIDTKYTQDLDGCMPPNWRLGSFDIEKLIKAPHVNLQPQHFYAEHSPRYTIDYEGDNITVDYVAEPPAKFLTIVVDNTPKSQP